MPRAISPRVVQDILDEGQESESSESGVDASTDEEQLDKPRVAQWIDDAELQELANEDESSVFAALDRDISELPLGALIKAQKVVTTTAYDSDDQSEPSDADQSKMEEQDAGASTSVSKEHRSIEHRSNKHAPMEVTSKKPVPRRRQAVEVHRVRPRDPRFSDLSGALSIQKFRSHYEFLPSLHTSELSTLKESLSRARKLLITSPRQLRPEREEEVQRLELAVKRAESTVNRERREQAERQALASVYQEEKEKRKAGKRAWWMKDADERAIRLRARMAAIAATGGKRAVKKAIEKKQRKVGQKEKKSRPFAPEKRASGSEKRYSNEGEGNERAVKRPRVE